MKTMMRKTRVAVLGLFSMSMISGMRAEEAPVFMQFVRPLGMGGAFTAVADDHNIFSFNPAGMVQRTGGQVTLLEVGLGATTGTKDVYDFVSDNKDDLSNFDKLTSERQTELVNEIVNDLSKLDPRVSIAADVASYVSGPRFMGLPMHVGFGAFGVVDASFKLGVGPAMIPNVSYSINNDIVIPLTIAHRWDAPFIPGKIGLGITGKLINRNQVKEDRLSVIGLEDYDAPPLTKGKGFGSDVGMLYQPTTRTNIGVMVQDFLGTKMKFEERVAEKGYAAVPERETVIRPRTNIGMAMTPDKLLWLLPTGERWTFSADIRDIFQKGEHLFFEDGFNHVIGEDLYTHLHLGAEFRYWFMRFRGGAYQGYPSLGLGLDIPILKLDAAYYSRELGAHAGDRREENFVMSLALRFGSGHTEARERIQKSKESNRMKLESAPEKEPEASIQDEAAPK